MKAAIFDLFGTLVHIDSPTWPYRELLRHATHPQARELAMTSALAPAKLASAVGANVSPADLAAFEQAVEAEVDRIRVYDDTRDTLALLRDAGFVILVSSNLAKPYAAARNLLGDLVDYWNFSFDTGVLKPNPQMFTAPAAAFGVRPHRCIVIGDSLASDAAGAQAAGMPFILVDRAGRHAPHAGVTHLSHLFDKVMETLPG